MKCPFCDKEAVWCENKAIYGKNYGKSYMCWFCKPCRAYVGCHQNTKKPLGTIANKETREWRIKLHAIIDPLWKSGKQKRSDVYMGLNAIAGKEFHVGESSVEDCKNMIEKLKEITF